MIAPMATTAIALDPETLERARALLEKPVRRQRVWPVLLAASAFALSALLFAAAMIAAPPLTSEHPGLARSIE